VRGALEPSTAWYADGSAGGFVASPIEGTSRSDTPVAMAIDDHGTVHVLVMDERLYEFAGTWR